MIVIDQGAHFSPCRTWRYSLWRVWGTDGTRVAFIGLNPSTADETQDDPTVRRCINFARAWGYDGMYMLNLFGLRSTNPKGLWKVKDPTGPGNYAAIARNTHVCGMAVVAWGANVTSEQWTPVLEHIKCEMVCLGLTKSGAPRHPLYVKGDTQVIPFI